jgi:hypothetical protein
MPRGNSCFAPDSAKAESGAGDRREQRHEVDLGFPSGIRSIFAVLRSYPSLPDNSSAALAGRRVF